MALKRRLFYSCVFLCAFVTLYYFRTEPDTKVPWPKSRQAHWAEASREKLAKFVEDTQSNTVSADGQRQPPDRQLEFSSTNSQSPSSFGLEAKDRESASSLLNASHADEPFATSVRKRNMTSTERKLLKAAQQNVDQFHWSVSARGRHPNEVHHVVFVKVHKAASSTVQNILFRFGSSRNLNLMLPIKGHILSQRSYAMNILLPHPPSPPFLFDILCNHVVYNHAQMSKYFHADSRFLAIVRQPWDQVKSAILYYTLVFHPAYLKNVRSFKEYIHHQREIEPANPYLSRSNNRMSIDLGLPRQQLANASYVGTFLSYLEEVFHLVLIAERFDESMVLMRRVLRWTTKDILYRKVNTLKTPPPTPLTPDPDLLEQFSRFEYFDVAVYDHFAEVFEVKVAEQGEDFQNEVREYRRIEKQVNEFCNGSADGRQELTFPASKWSDSFSLLRTECSIMVPLERELNEWVRNQQVRRLAPIMYSDIKPEDNQ